MPAESEVMTDDVFLDHVTDRLAALPGVRAVALGGSRAQGTQRPDSDWDFAIYYRGDFRPDDLRGVGWEGEVSEIGGWGGGVFNGGAWLTVDGRRVDVHYRDLDVVERELAEAERGHVRWEPLMFHLAGIPTYLVVAELAVNHVLRGTLPRPDRYPEALRKAAPEMWWGRASGTLHYAKANNAPTGGRAEVHGAVAVAAMSAAHAVLAARGAWVTNEKRLLERAGLLGVHSVLAGTSADLADVVDRAQALLERAVDSARRTR